MSLKPISGRAELLQWINVLTCSGYTSVGHLNDGVAYATVVEMLSGGATTGVPPFLHKLPSFDCNADDYGDDAAAAPAPAPPARQLAERREANFRFVEALMRSGTAVPTKWCLQIHPGRLAQGKLQDHMQLLAHLHKWFCSAVNTSGASGGGKLRFVDDPVARRCAASEGKPLSVSLQVPESAAIRELHARFVASLPECAFAESNEGAAQPAAPTMTMHAQMQQRLDGAEQRRQLQNQVAAFGRSATAQPQPSGADLSHLTGELEDLTIEINRDLDNAAVQLEFRRSQLHRDALALKKLVAQRDALQTKLRSAYATVQRGIMMSDGDDGANGFRADLHRLFTDTAAGRGIYSPSQILATAVMHTN